MDQIVRYFFDFSLMAAFWPDILRGFLITVQMSILTILILWLAYKVIPPLLDWLVFNSVLPGEGVTNQTCRASGGSARPSSRRGAAGIGRA